MRKIEEDQVKGVFKKWLGLAVMLAGCAVFWLGSSVSIQDKSFLGNTFAIIGFIIAVIGLIIHFRIIFSMKRYKE